MTEAGRRRLTLAFAGFLIAVVIGGFFVGRSLQVAVLESSSGSVSEVVLDPAAPGFRAFTDATPTLLVVHTTVTSRGAELVGATILAPAGEGIGGAVVTFQSTFVVDASSPTLAEVFTSSGLDPLVAQLGAVTGSGFSDVVVLDASAWTSLMREDLPLDVSLRTDLIEVEQGVSSTLLPSGTRSFDLFDIALIASHQNPSEPSLGLALRQQEIWRSWISRTAGSDERPELFELDTGFSAVIGALASGEVSYRPIPTSTLSDVPPETTRYLADDQAIRELFAQIVPFPQEVEPGDRPPVLLLDSTLGQLDRDEFVQIITASGGRVTILGNTDGEPEAVNRVQLHDPSGAELADVLVDEFGAELEDVPLEDATAALTVIMATPPASS